MTNENIIKDVPNNIMNIITTQQELIHILEGQMIDLMMTCEIKLEDDVIDKIMDLKERLKKLTNQ